LLLSVVSVGRRSVGSADFNATIDLAMPRQVSKQRGLLGI
jgi:hypothetical protein